MAGPFAAALEFSTGKTAVVVGKPSSAFFHAAVADVGCAVDVPALLPECVMIGDDAVDDVQGAMDAGMRAILVRTGKYQAGDEERCRTPPLAVVDSFPDAVDFLHREGLLD
uniref:Phospholysine phosphohistidine inorganic pyrophosphate phosphatase n=1 Tax=Alexandrium andersonii TaxID=327968 RepID=A0A7S2HLI8_9DINO|mmetsp:Transcript_72864/g.163149  ORF Transcript_72864/g.163149 Transcript_72864/m.163149 type:complete len:111 (+) Transcript_72864:1-333(+)